MSVIRGRKIIFCEGKENSLDYLLLSKILDDSSIHDLTIVPAGSKFTFSIFAQGYLSNVAGGNHQYLVFRDRDFDAEPSDAIRLLNRNSMLLSYRTCVENYLLDATLINTYWEEKYLERIENPFSRWGHNTSPGIEAISSWIETSARDIQDYQAVRWALGELASMSEAREHLATTWTNGSGCLPEQLCLEHCQNRAVELITEFGNAVREITVERFNSCLARYQNRFTQPEFWQQRFYLIWFNGKDLQKEMQRREARYISLKDFYYWAVNHIDINRHQDLIELQEEIIHLSER